MSMTLMEHHALDKGGMQAILGSRQFYNSLHELFQLTMTSKIKKPKVKRKIKSPVRQKYCDLHMQMLWKNKNISLALEESSCLSAIAIILPLALGPSLNPSCDLVSFYILFVDTTESFQSLNVWFYFPAPVFICGMQLVPFFRSWAGKWGCVCNICHGALGVSV